MACIRALQCEKNWRDFQLSLTSDEHDTDGEDLLRVGVGRDIPKAHAGQTAEGEVEGRDILIFDGRA